MSSVLSVVTFKTFANVQYFFRTIFHRKHYLVSSMKVGQNSDSPSHTANVGALMFWQLNVR